jgi:two-component system chemotaxis response regulator CheY
MNFGTQYRAHHPSCRFAQNRRTKTQSVIRRCSRKWHSSAQQLERADSIFCVPTQRKDSGDGMASPTINFRDMTILIADSSSYLSMLVHGMLRGFGATKILQVRDSLAVLQALSNQKFDALLCDAWLPPHGGLKLTHAIRRKVDNENRMIPILVMSSDTRETAIKSARDAGANMVIAKPISPSSLYDRMAWVALTPRRFIDAPTYFGPDRRFKIEGYPNGVGRRKGDNVEVAEETGPALAQGDIDNLFSAARMGQD